MSDPFDGEITPMAFDRADRSTREVWFLNRMLFVVRPKRPFVEWAVGIEGRGPDLIPDHVYESVTGYLAPQFDFTADVWEWLREHCELVFEMELAAWCRNEALWPQDRSWEVLTAWLDVELVDLAWDLVDAPLSSAPD